MSAVAHYTGWSMATRNTTSAVAYVRGEIFARRLDLSRERDLPKQFRVPDTIRIFRNQFVVGEQQIWIDILHGRS